MQNRVDQLFIRLAKLFRTIEEKGLIPVKLVEEKDIIDKFYNKSISMVLDRRIPEHIDLILSFELAKAIRDNLDDDIIKCLILVKKLLYRNLFNYYTWVIKKILHISGCSIFFLFAQNSIKLKKL